MINKFRGKYAFLSNFYPSEVIYEYYIFPTVEHAYQAAKSLEEEDRVLIQKAKTPREAKKLGRCLQLRSDWDSIKLILMSNLLNQKFEIPALRSALLKTSHEELVEENTWGDTYWGICKGEGTNWLGVLLMAIRADIQQDDPE